MSWIQENKFVAGLIGVTAVVGGGILFFGNSQGNAYEEKMESFETLKGKYSTLEKSTPYPNAENRKAKEEAMATYHQAINEVRKGLNSYRPEKLETLSPEQFSDLRVDISKSLRAKFEEAGTTLPEETEFGFEKYAKSAIKSAATPKLNYQLGATQWLLSKLAETKPDALVNIVRTPLPIETGKPAAAPAPRGRNNRAGRANANRKGAQGAAPDGPYQLMPMELTFTADEAAVRDFLKEMVGSDKYFFAIRSLRVRNEKQTAPSEADANFPAPAAAPAAGDPFAGFPGLGDSANTGEGDVAAGADDAGAAPAPAANSGEQILKQVLGDESLNVHIVFDIVLLKPVSEQAAETAAN
ncbi:Amuc_1100 family pilus-like protein [Verrucomicrobiaceae bacterium 5K15]|uniref:Uncharacterized protein n=1 Tax=Oceaniferula flava TaxID=2800421 RepID=A0AAE2S9D9_9BACT|nr:Amuc_1100 family pilus-like protein [Oceaniferula flavus]MBK1853621.1 hypothetical protein [Oceaniferula flavus]MBM1134926.1 Amuc_1100 family pilus-like protein [Oceaniferula flavus]